MKMKKTDHTVTDDDKQLFKDAIGKVKAIKQDTIIPVKKLKAFKRGISHQNNKKVISEFYFSDSFEPNLNQQGPTKYVRDDVDSFEIKNLRRGYYTPDLILDLHGLDQQQSKREIASLLAACQKEHAQCLCIVHGLGTKTLKNKVPHWLVQHPDVMAFHQAPLEWGGNGALLVLMELHDKFNRN